jgi:hypothetical protein
MNEKSIEIFNRIELEFHKQRKRQFNTKILKINTKIQQIYDENQIQNNQKRIEFLENEFKLKMKLLRMNHQIKLYLIKKSLKYQKRIIKQQMIHEYYKKMYFNSMDSTDAMRFINENTTMGRINRILTNGTVDTTNGTIKGTVDTTNGNIVDENTRIANGTTKDENNRIANGTTKDENTRITNGTIVDGISNGSSMYENSSINNININEHVIKYYYKINEFGFPSGYPLGLRENEIENDVSLIKHKQENPNILKESNNLYIQKDLLYIGNDIIKSGDSCYLHDAGTRFTVVIKSIDLNDVYVQRVDGSKSKVSLSLLKQKKVYLIKK